MLVAAEPAEMEVGDAPQAVRRVADALDGGPPLGNDLAHRSFEDGDEQVVLALVVEVDGAGRDPGHPGDVGHLRLEEAVLGEHPGRRAENQVALVTGGAGLFHRGQAPGGYRHRPPR